MTIKNGDLPAMPLANGADGSPWMINDLGNPALVIGLTKREHFAAMAMQGILACNSTEFVHSTVQRAIECADELLRKLEDSK